MKKILAYRFSAFGDVAMVAVILQEVLEQNPGTQIIMISRPQFKPLFDHINGVVYHAIDLDKYKGFFGMNKLAKELITTYNPDAVADLHNVIRTKILNKIFRSKGFLLAKIDKGKIQKEQLVDIWNLDKQQLKQTVERYADVFSSLGFPVVLSHRIIQKETKKNGIGFAPFAQHKGKMLPIEKCFELAQKIAAREKIYFFGGGKQEIELLNQWEQMIPNSVNLAGKLSLEEELKKISTLRLMISMDSANMHLASLSGTRCISIWGSTHHFAGFLGYGQKKSDIIEVKDLTCRPCSVFGDKKCYRGDYACLNEQDVSEILSKVFEN